jgi:protein arginine kinase
MLSRCRLDFDLLSQRSGEWLKASGPESDIVMSSRIRLARNVATFPFVNRASEATRADVEQLLATRISELAVRRPLTYLKVNNLDAIDRQLLVERQLISREQAEDHGQCGVGFTDEENVSVMVNEEDHLRLQVLRSGLALESAWDEINDLDDEIEAKVTYAYDSKLGYLTACPTNIGTGIRVSVLLHLPVLQETKEIQKVFQALQKIGLAVRGLYGEGSQAMGDFYQISNQATLGKSEAEIIENIGKVVHNIIGYERRVRTAMVKENRQTLHDDVAKAYGNLKSAQRISSEETMRYLSKVRLGINLGLIDDVEIPTVNQLFVQTQPAHLQKLKHERLESAERNVVRAAYIRQRLAGESSS